MTQPPPDGARAIRSENGTLDVAVFRAGREYTLLGPAGPQREYAFIPEPSAAEADILPVLIGAGAGYGLSLFLERLDALPVLPGKTRPPLIVLDAEADILEAAAIRERFAPDRVLLISDRDPDTALKLLTKVQAERDYPPLKVAINPFYPRINRAYYDRLRDACLAGEKGLIRQQAQRRRFSGDKPRILLLTSKYFLMGEILAACERLDLPHRLLRVPDGEYGKNEFVEDLLRAVLEFSPDFVFTINHLGVDREGVLADLLEKLRLPLASWFVDNPHLVLYLYNSLVSPWTAIFTWDADNLESLRSMGFEHVSYLPLGCDTHRFTPGREKDARPEWRADVSFVGNSMVSKVLQRKERSLLPPELDHGYEAIAAGFAASDERSVGVYLRRNHPELTPAFEGLHNAEQRLGYETMLTWEATRVYRLSCVKATLPFSPLIAGDVGWRELLPHSGVRFHGELNYYNELPAFYPCSAVNFNCTSKQMKGAVNQRVFDVPATGSFLITDYREQVENLFEPGTEIVCYHSPEEAGGLIRRFLAEPRERARIAAAARKRVLAEHSYELRVRSLCRTMRDIYGRS